MVILPTTGSKPVAVQLTAEIATLRNVYKHYGAVPALADVSLTLRPGEVLALLGPNGAGKTTVVSCSWVWRSRTGGWLGWWCGFSAGRRES